MKRKFISEETIEEENYTKMLRLNQSCDVQNMEISDVTSAIVGGNARNVAFKL